MNRSQFVHNLFTVYLLTTYLACLIIVLQGKEKQIKEITTVDSVNTIIEQLIVQYSMEKLTNNVYFSEEHKLVLTIDNSIFTQGFSLHHIK